MGNAMMWKSPRGWAAVLAIAGILAITGCAETFTREDFTGKVNGKSMQDVRSEIGKPAKVDADEAGTVRWTYERRTIDIENKNKWDERAVVVFTAPASGSEATVSEVRFE